MQEVLDMYSHLALAYNIVQNIFDYLLHLIMAFPSAL